MSGLSNKMKDIQLKIEKLIFLHSDLLKQNGELKKERAELLEQQQILKASISNLEDKIKIIKLAKSLSGKNEDSHAAKLKINELVREIDKSIALLNR